MKKLLEEISKLQSVFASQEPPTRGTSPQEGLGVPIKGQAESSTKIKSLPQRKGMWQQVRASLMRDGTPKVSKLNPVEESYILKKSYPHKIS